MERAVSFSCDLHFFQIHSLIHKLLNWWLMAINQRVEASLNWVNSSESRLQFRALDTWEAFRIALSFIFAVNIAINVLCLMSSSNFEFEWLNFYPIFIAAHYLTNYWPFLITAHCVWFAISNDNYWPLLALVALPALESLDSQTIQIVAHLMHPSVKTISRFCPRKLIIIRSQKSTFKWSNGRQAISEGDSHVIRALGCRGCLSGIRWHWWRSMSGDRSRWSVDCYQIII